jgi:hypothetical protein
MLQGIIGCAAVRVTCRNLLSSGLQRPPQVGAGPHQWRVEFLSRQLAPWYLGAWYLAAAYHQAGDHELSQELARTLGESHGHTFGAAIYRAAAGEGAAMFEALDGAFQQRDSSLVHIKNPQFVDPYRADPRFQALLRRMDLA